MRRPRTILASAAALLAGLLAAPPLPAEGAGGKPLSAVATLGKAMFFDPALSASGAMSCAFCHQPANHYGPPGDTPVMLGGPGMDLPGFRAVPSIAYKATTPAFTLGAEDPTSESAEATPMQVAETSDIMPLDAANALGKLVAAMKAPAPKASGAAPGAQVAKGGMFWDGRAASLQDQALGPLMAPFEMANTDLHTLAERVRKGYAAPLGQLFGAQVVKDDRRLVDEAAYAIARFEVEDASFQPFSSKYDAYLAGKAQLSPQEARGLKLFDDPKKGNCAACHLDRPSADGRPPLFTDFEFEALAVPRNPAIPANADPGYHDLGLCGPLRADAYAGVATNCGLFKTPTLRNVATRKVFFHNGVYHSLTDVVNFYVNRDTAPEQVYPKAADGTLALYDDLPRQYWGNIDTIDAPFDRHRGDPPALTPAEVADVVAFLGTLTDGWKP